MPSGALQHMKKVIVVPHQSQYQSSWQNTRDGDRTRDPRFRKPTLYPLSYASQKVHFGGLGKPPLTEAGRFESIVTRMLPLIL